MHESPEPRRRGALCGGERRQRPSQLWQREHGRVVLDQSMKIRLDGVEVAVRLERRGEVPREAPHELDARRVVGAAAQERDLPWIGAQARRDLDALPSPLIKALAACKTLGIPSKQQAFLTLGPKLG